MRGITPRVTIVVTPENYENAFNKIKYFARDYGVNIHPVLKQDFSWEESGLMHIWREAEAIAAGTPNVTFIKTISNAWIAERYDRCQAGIDYFCLMPDGNVLRCYSHLLSGKSEGDIRDYTPPKAAQECHVDCMFPCDREIARKGIQC